MKKCKKAVGWKLRKISGAVLAGQFAVALAMPTPLFASSIYVAEGMESVLDIQPAGNVSCFDYYRFGSVGVELSSTPLGAYPGTPLTFFGKIKNANAYPVVGLDVYVKIFQKQANVEKAQANGHYLVDQFVAVNDLNLPAMGERPINFEWSIPPRTEPGDYLLATYTMTAERYNLSGLSFTDDVTGSTVPFTIKGEKDGTVAWDKNQVLMNDNIYRFAAYPLVFSVDETVKVEAPLVNTTGSDQQVNITWKQYSWDGLREEALVESKTETLTVKAGDSKKLAHFASKAEGAVTYIVADASVGATHSILDMRFARSGIEQPRINFPSLSAFPLKTGQEVTLFSCLHAVGPETLADGKLELHLMDEKGGTIAKEIYAGEITSAMMGVARKFTPEKNFDRATLTAVLSHRGEVIETSEVIYDCRTIDPNVCSNDTSAVDAVTSRWGGWRVALISLVVLLPVLALFFFRKRRKQIV